MAEIKIIPKEKEMPKLKKVAAYARVSIDTDQMLHSLSSQVSYFSEFIQSHPDWQYVGVYYDRGKTGTKASRGDFQRLLDDAKKGLIDVIITKSLSRFARNTVDCLKAIRELKAIGVDIYFQEQNIHTLSANGEFLITLLAGYAQEESRQCSENVLWRVKKNFSEGRLASKYDCLGYKVENKEFTIIEEEAKIVRKIYDLYLKGYGYYKIAKILNEDGLRGKQGGLWSQSSINQILDNEVYTGKLVLQKTYSENHLSKRRMVNKGEKQKYVVDENHEPIISLEDFNKVQELRTLKRKDPSSYVPKGPKRDFIFTGLIKCGICGSTYRHKQGAHKIFWKCNTFLDKGKDYCASTSLRDDCLRKACAKVLDITVFDESKFKQNISFLETYPGNKLVFHFTDGNVKEVEYEPPKKRCEWSIEAINKARERSKLQYAKRKNNTEQN